MTQAADWRSGPRWSATSMLYLVHPFASSRHFTHREACHWIRGSLLSPMNPVPLPPQGETRALRDWLSVSYSMISVLVISRYAAPPYPAAPDFLHGKACHTILRSLCSLTNRVPLPPHPGDRIKRSMLSCRDMIPLLSIHSAPACGGKVVAPATKGGKTPKWYMKHMTPLFFPHIPRFPLRGSPA